MPFDSLVIIIKRAHKSLLVVQWEEKTRRTTAKATAAVRKGDRRS